MIKAERDIIKRVDGLPVDLAAMAVVSNIWRASQMFRQNVEREVLSEYNLTWASFSTLYIVWVWAPIEMGSIAESQSVGRSTITSTVKLLEQRGYVLRQHKGDNRRTVWVTLTAEGQTLIEEVFPAFNRYEKRFVNGLTTEEAETLTRLLRKIITNAEPSRE